MKSRIRALTRKQHECEIWNVTGKECGMGKRMMVCGRVDGCRLVYLRYMQEVKSGHRVCAVLGVYWRQRDAGLLSIGRRYARSGVFEETEPRPAA